MATKTVTANKSSQFRSSNLGGGNDEHIAIGNNGSTWRAAVDFPAIDWSALSGKQITGAKLWLRTTHGQHLSFSADPDAYGRRITAAWTANSGSVETSLSTNATAYPGPSATTTGQAQNDISPSPGVWDYLNVVGIVEAWAPSSVYKRDGTTGDDATQYGILLLAVSEAQGDDKVEWRSAENSIYKPYLEITYTDQATPIVAISSIGGSSQDGAGITDQTPEVRWTAENSSYDSGDSDTFSEPGDWEMQYAAVSGYGVSPGSWGSALFNQSAYFDDWDGTAYVSPVSNLSQGQWYAFRTMAVSAAGTPVGYSPTQWRYVTNAPGTPVLTGGVKHIHNLGDAAKWTSGGSHAKPRFTLTVTDSDGDTVANVQIRLKTSSGGSTWVTETHAVNVPSGTEVDIDMDQALVNGTTYYADCRIQDEHGGWSSYSSEVSFRVRWGQAQYEHNAGAGSSQWLLDLGTLNGDGVHAATVFGSVSSSGSTPGTWYTNIGEVPVQAYAVILVRIANAGASVSTPAELEDMQFSYSGSPDSPDHWTASPTSEWLLDLAARRYGSRSFRCQVNTSSNGTADRYTYPFRSTVGDSIPIQPNTTYIFSAWVKTVGVLGGSGIYVSVREGHWGELYGNSLAEQGWITDSSDGPDGWKRIWFQFTSGPGDYLCMPMIEYSPNGSAGNGDIFFIDAVQLEEGTVVGPWSPGLVGEPLTLDKGGIRIDAAGGVSLRMRGANGGVRDIIEIGDKGLLFGGDANLYSSAVNTLDTDDSLNVGVDLDVGSDLTVGGSISGPTSISTSGNVTADNVSPANNVQEFTSNGTWTKPSGNYRWCKVICIGAGGGGGSGRRGAEGTHRQGGGGGGGGGMTVVDIPYSEMASSYSVNVGTGGSGGSATAVNGTNGNAGSNGGDSYLGSSGDSAVASAQGGAGGAGGTESSGYTAGGRGGRGTFPGENGGSGNNYVGRPGGIAYLADNAGATAAYGLIAGGAGGGGGAGGRISGNTNNNGGEGGLGGALGAQTVPAGGVAGSSAGANGDSNASEIGYHPVGQGGGGGAGTSTASAYSQGGNGGAYGGGGGGSGAQQNSGTTKPGGTGANGYVAVITY